MLNKDSKQITEIRQFNLPTICQGICVPDKIFFLFHIATKYYQMEAPKENLNQNTYMVEKKLYKN